MSRRSVPHALWRPGAILVALLFLAAVAPLRAQVRLTVDPMMTRGPEGALVTIVEFSDYQ